MNLVLKELIGAKFTETNRICDLIGLTFETKEGKKIIFHVQCLIRILKEGKVLVSSEEMYFSAEKEKNSVFDWTKDFSIYDACMKKERERLTKLKIVKIENMKQGDIFFYFEKGYCLQIIVNRTHNEEKYRVMKDNEHYVFK